MESRLIDPNQQICVTSAPPNLASWQSEPFGQLAWLHKGISSQMKTKLTEMHTWSTFIRRWLQLVSVILQISNLEAIL